MNENININSYDFLSFPHNPEDFYTLLYVIEKNDNYKIYKAIHNETREIYAIKIIPLDNRISYQQLKKEFLIMKSLKNCENIVKYYGSFFSFNSKNIWLIYEYCPAGSVYDLLKVIKRPLIEQEISIIINDIIHALIYMHQLNIAHGNIKLTNILLSENAKAKLGNFTRANQQIDTNISLSSLEQSLQDRNDPKYDIFLLGIVCMELFKGIQDFDRNQFMETIKYSQNNGNSLKQIIEKNFVGLGCEQLCSKEFIDFIQKCLDTNIYKRPTAFELKNHSFIKNNINAGNSEKIYFLNLIKYNIERIEFYKKEKNYNNLNQTINSKKINNFDNSINSNDRKTKNSFINNKENNSINISNFVNNNYETINSHNNDKIAEFNFKQMGNDEEVEYDRYTNKDILVDNSNLNNTGFHYCTDESLDNKSLKESAVFGKGEFKRKKNNHKTVANQKDMSFLKNLIKTKKIQSILAKEKINNNSNNSNYNNNTNNSNNNNNKNNNINFSISDYDNHLTKKESDDIDYLKENWDHLDKYKEILKTKNSIVNNNYDYNKNFLNFNTDDSFDNMNFSINNFNNSINNNFNFNYNYNNNNFKKSFIPFSEIKCNVIQLGSSIKKYKANQKPNKSPHFSLKNSISKENEPKEFSLKNSMNNKSNINNENSNKNSFVNSNSQKLLISFRNNAFEVLDNNSKKSYNKDKHYKNDINSTYFSSFNTRINKGSMEIISQKHYSSRPFFTLRKKRFEEINYNLINPKNFGDEKEKNINILKKSESEFNFIKDKGYRRPCLYKYIKELDNKKEIIKNNTTTIIKVKGIFNKKKNEIIKKI